MKQLLITGTPPHIRILQAIPPLPTPPLLVTCSILSGGPISSIHLSREALHAYTSGESYNIYYSLTQDKKTKTKTAQPGIHVNHFATETSPIGKQYNQSIL